MKKNQASKSIFVNLFKDAGPGADGARQSVPGPGADEARHAEPDAEPDAVPDAEEQQSV